MKPLDELKIFSLFLGISVHNKHQLEKFKKIQFKKPACRLFQNKNCFWQTH